MAVTKTNRKRRGAPFAQGLSTSSWLKLYAAVFFTFMPVFVLFSAGVRSNGAWHVLLLWSVISGLVGVSYAGVFTHGRPKLLFVVVPAHFALIVLNAIGYPAMFQVDITGADGTGLYIVFTIAVGYAFFSWFIRTEGARTLRLAAQIHESLVPGIRIETDRIEVFASSIASSEMGGDLIDVVREDDGAISLYLADVSGHGVRAGVLMAMIKSAIRASHLRPTTLATTCAELNTVIDQVKEPDMFATYASMRIGSDGSIGCALAGHLPIVQISGIDGVITRHDNESLPLGVVAEESFAERRVEAEPGDCFALYTDGLSEAADSQRRLFGTDAVDAILREQRAAPLESIFDSALAAVRAHEDGEPGDDQTLMLVRIK
jgi:hypothetical protein